MSKDPNSLNQLVRQVVACIWCEEHVDEEVECGDVVDKGREDCGEELSAEELVSSPHCLAQI